MIDPADIYESISTRKIIRILEIDTTKMGIYIKVEYMKSGLTSWYYHKDFEKLFRRI